MTTRLVAFFLFVLCSISQGADAQIKVRFDSTGLLRQAPKEWLRSSRSVQFQIPVTKYLADSQSRIVTTRLSYLDRVVNDKTTDEMAALRLRFLNLYHYLQLSDQTTKDCVEWAAFINAKCPGVDEMRMFMIKMYADSVSSLKAPVFGGNCGKACKCEQAKLKLAELKEVLQQLQDLSLREELIRELLCNYKDQKAELFNLADIKKPSKNELAAPVALNKPANIRPDTFRFGNKYFIKKDTFALTISGKDTFYSKTMALGRRNRVLNAPIFYVNQFDKTVLDWHNAQEPLLDRDYLKEITTEVISDTARVNCLQADYYQCKDCNEQGGSLKELNTLLAKYDTVWCEANTIGRWIINWLWFSGHDFKLNFMKFTSPGNLASDDDLERETTLLANLEEQKQRIIAIKKCQGCSEKTLDTLRRMQDSLKVIELQMSTIAKAKDRRAKNESALKKFSTVNFAFHSLQIPLFNSDNKRVVLYHDVNNQFERTPSKKAVYPDDRTVYFGFYNSKEKDTTGVLAIKEEISKFNDTGVFLQNLIAATAGLQAAAALINPYAGPVNALLKNLGRNTAPSTTFSQQESLGKDKASLTDCDKLRLEIGRRLWRFNLLKTMLLDYKKLNTPGKLNEQKDETSGFNTYIVKAKESDAPFTNTYSVTYKQKGVATEKFSVGRQKLLAFGAGFFYNAQPVKQVKVDTSGGNFLVSTTDTRTKFVVGVKLFPFKLFEPDGAIVPKYPLKRVSVFLGFEATKPLENLYAGLGWDVVPGLQISAGAHIYRKDSYVIQNNRITDKSSNYQGSGWYYGVTLDPIALTGLLKSFFQ